MPAAHKENRRSARIQPFVCPCSLIEGDKRLSGYLTDLSPEGARISCDAPLLPATEVVTIEVRFSRRGKAARLGGRVEWRSPGTKSGEAMVFGVSFEEAGAEERALIASVVQQFRQRAALLA